MEDVRTSQEIAAKAIATEYTLRLRNAVARARMAQEDLKRTSGDPAFKARALEQIQGTALMAERGFRLDQLCETSSANGFWLAAEAILIKNKVEGGSFSCATVPGCSAEDVCAMNNIIERRLSTDGCKNTLNARTAMPVAYQAIADGCIKMRPRVFHEGDPHLATSSRSTGDTASVKARG